VLSQRPPVIGIESATTRHLTDTCIPRRYDLSLFLHASAAGSPTDFLAANSEASIFDAVLVQVVTDSSTTNVFYTIAISFCLFTTTSYTRHCARRLGNCNF